MVKKLQIPFLSFTFLMAISSMLWASDTMTETQPEELGKVKWLRDMKTAQSKSVAQDKPILILFQEVPGCSTCQRYGNDILSHPLIVEAIESLFIPMAVYNNKQGADRKELDYFGEPSWNNPVVRIVGADKKDIAPRLGGNYSMLGLVQSMLLALDRSNQVAPRYLQLLAEELEAEAVGLEEATLAMYCFWTGEKEIGNIPGVVSTEAGFMGGKEVVKVAYNPLIVSYGDLVEKAEKASCASHVFTENEEQQQVANKIVGSGSNSRKEPYRPDREPKYYLSKTIWKYVPMTPLQAVKANSLIGQRKSPNRVLSPRQIALATFIENNKNRKWKDFIGTNIMKGWETFDRMKNG